MDRKRVIKIIAICVMIMVSLVLFAGCERKMGNRIVDGKDVQTFTYCYVVLGGKEVVKGAITQWRDYDNSDTIQVLVNGKYYLTHYTNVVLIADPNQGPLAYGDSDWAGIDE